MIQRNDPAVITALWIGEEKPDTMSAVIQWFLSLQTKDRHIKYSHNAILFHYTGMIWHSTLSDDPAKCGVIEETQEEALAGSIIRYQKEIKLNLTNGEFAMWLEGERGKRYSNRQNMANLIPLLKSWARNGDEARNCSEFLAKVCQFSEYQFPKDLDFILPTDTFRVILPTEPNQ